MYKYLSAATLLSLLLASTACSDRHGAPANGVPDAGAAMTAGGEYCPVSGSGMVDGSHRDVLVPAGTFALGSNQHYREEAPQRQVDVAEFRIDIHEVTNRQFAEFVRQTNYVTSAEKPPAAADYPDIPVQDLVAGSALFVAPTDDGGGQWARWWQYVAGASWKHPEGPNSNLAGREDHPVVHVTYLDATAYAEWAGRSLPTEAQWERVAQAFSSVQKANTWQGVFPVQNRALDGFSGTAPVGCYPPNDLGVHDMIGNVWELVSDVYQVAGSPQRGDGQNAAGATMRVIKGGSYLCAENFCRRDRPQSRQPQEEDFGAAHIGFRTVVNSAEQPVN